MSEPLSRHIPILDRGKHSAEKKRKSIGILVRRSNRLRDEVFWIPADLADGGMSFKNKAILADDCHRHIHPSHVIETETPVEQAQKRPDRAGCVVVFRLREQK